MRKPLRIVVTCMVLVVCLMAGYAFLTMAGLRARTVDPELLMGDVNGLFASAEECFSLTTRAWIAALCMTSSLTALAWILTEKKPKLHLAALALLLPAGVMIALCKPTMAWYTWDEETHYEVMQGLLGAPGATLTDRVMAMNLWDVGYLPTLLGMTLARVLGLGSVLEYKLGALVGTVVYAALCTLAVRHAPKYKLTFLALAAAPLTLFQAASCTYDATVIGSVLLAMALLSEEWTTPGRLTGPRALSIVALLTLGTVSKPAYSLLLLLLLTLPKDKFGSASRAWAWRGFVLAMTVWALLSLLMPGTYDNVKNGDSRYGDVSSQAQLQFVLQHPGEAFGILRDYVRGYWISLHTSDLAHWGGLGNDLGTGRLLALGVLLLCPLCSVGEKEQSSPLTWRRRLLMLAMETLVLLVLVVTQFMVSGDRFTEGMQARYTMPVWVLLALSAMLPEVVRRLVRPAGKVLAVGALGALACITYGVAGHFLFGVIAGMA